LLYNGATVELFGDKRMQQTFTANYPGLSQVDILFKDAPNEQKIDFHLRETCDAEADTIHSSTILPSIDDFTFYPFTFPPIDDSAGQTYCIVLEARDATPETAVKLQLSTGNLYPYGKLSVHNPKVEQDYNSNEDPISDVDQFRYQVYLPIIMNAPQGEGDLIEDLGFLLHYKGHLLPTAEVFVARLTANKPLVWGQPWFYGGLVIAYVVLLVGLFYVARQTVQTNSQE
jgi:hypothetical protein